MDMGDSEREVSERGEFIEVIIVVVGDWGVPRSGSVSRCGGVSRYDGGIAGSAQRVLVGVLIVIDADSTELADVSIYDGEGGMHGSAQRGLAAQRHKEKDSNGNE